MTAKVRFSLLTVIVFILKYLFIKSVMWLLISH